MLVDDVSLLTISLDMSDTLTLGLSARPLTLDCTWLCICCFTCCVNCWVISLLSRQASFCCDASSTDMSVMLISRPALIRCEKFWRDWFWQLISNDAVIWTKVSAMVRALDLAMLAAPI